MFLEQNIAKKIAREFIKAIKNERIISAYLYGSTVTGDLKPESDIDVLVILEKHDKRKERRIYDKASHVSYERNKTISPLIMDAKELEKEKETQFMRSVKENCQRLYGKESL